MAMAVIEQLNRQWRFMRRGLWAIIIVLFLVWSVDGDLFAHPAHALQSAFGSFSVGALLMAANLLVMGAALRRLLEGSDREGLKSQVAGKKLLSALLLSSKTVLMLTLVAVAFLWLQISPLPFVAGTMVVMGIPVAALMREL